MKQKWILISFFIISITLVILLVIATWLTKKYDNNIESVVIVKDDNESYEKMVIRNYNDYQEVLTKYNILGKLRENDFTSNDYILDFIPYVEDMQIINIAININDNNISINYETKPKIINENEKILINFIPIPKDMDNRENIKITNNFK